MKKNQKLTAVIAAVMTLCSTAMPAHAEELYYWGTAPGKEFTGMTCVDDKGMLAWVTSGMTGEKDNYRVYVQHTEDDITREIVDQETGEITEETVHRAEDQVFCIVPRRQTLSIRMRPEIDREAGETRMLEILQQYYPDITDAVHESVPYYTHSDTPVDEVTFARQNEFSRVYYMIDLSETSGSEEIADGIMHDLAAAGLINAFYSWGQTADYRKAFFYYSPTQYDAGLLDEAGWEEVESWISVHAPAFQCVRTPESSEGGHTTAASFKVIPPDGTDFTEQFAVAADLYEQFGIRTDWFCATGTEEPMLGQNAMQKAGDITLDCAVDVSDAVLLARFCAEDAGAFITEQGKTNADCNGDGGITTDDVTVILRMIAKLI